MSGPEPRQYTAGEAVKLAMLVAAAVARGESPALNRAIDGFKAAAVAREHAEDQAREKVRQERIDAKAKRRAESKWF